jgi:hypothetical protein
LLLQFSPSLDASSFQSLSKIKSGVGCIAGTYFRAAMAAKNASTCAELSGWIVRAPKENRVGEAHICRGGFSLQAKEPGSEKNGFRNC